MCISACFCHPEDLHPPTIWLRLQSFIPFQIDTSPHSSRNNFIYKWKGHGRGFHIVNKRWSVLGYRKCLIGLKSYFFYYSSCFFFFFLLQRICRVLKTHKSSATTTTAASPGEKKTLFFNTESQHVKPRRTVWLLFIVFFLWNMFAPLPSVQDCVCLYVCRLYTIMVINMEKKKMHDLYFWYVYSGELLVQRASYTDHHRSQRRWCGQRPSSSHVVCTTIIISSIKFIGAHCTYALLYTYMSSGAHLWLMLAIIYFYFRNLRARLFHKKSAYPYRGLRTWIESSCINSNVAVHHFYVFWFER